ncbi:MAG: hypothetical protein IIV43_08710 [Oscillospiraceae bacterium]|nr:hypothetical protein [Oscillospiraceae bacterium]
MANEINEKEEILEEQTQEDINELRRIRLEKLENLQKAGKDPFARYVHPRADPSADERGYEL